MALVLIISLKVKIPKISFEDTTLQLLQNLLRQAVTLNKFL